MNDFAQVYRDVRIETCYSAWKCVFGGLFSDFWPVWIESFQSRAHGDGHFCSFLSCLYLRIPRSVPSLGLLVLPYQVPVIDYRLFNIVFLRKSIRITITNLIGCLLYPNLEHCMMEQLKQTFSLFLFGWISNQTLRFNVLYASLVLNTFPRIDNLNGFWYYKR